ncbi:MAG: hypothetical protein L0H73_01720 [Nitrococcus sp.]|nr:hypothetical protein [Nitrococcus sp.]
MYIVDLERNTCKRVIDWNDKSINWEGRGKDRGLRGIAFYEGMVLLAASDAILVYDTTFRLVESHRNSYLKHCHEIFVHKNKLYLTSTGYDSILEFDLEGKKFTRGWCFRPRLAQSRLMTKLSRRLRRPLVPRLSLFEPHSGKGPLPGDTIHLNNVFVGDNTLFVSGTGLNAVWGINDASLFRYGTVPLITHNARPFRDGILFNDTASERILYATPPGQILASFSINRYPDAQLLNAGLPKDHARQAFGRGLCLFQNNWIIGGSSPATISAYQLDGGAQPISTVNVTMDVRNAIHGLEIWPY